MAKCWHFRGGLGESRYHRGVTRKSLPVLVAALGLIGCGPRREEPYTTWAAPQPPYSPQGEDGFDGLCRAADAALTAAPDYADRVSFTDSMRLKAASKLGAAIQKADRATRSTVTFQYRLADAFEVDRRSAGWRLIGRALVWRTESQLQAGNTTAAVQSAVQATRMGLALTGGDAQLATLGYAICADARSAIAPKLDHLSQADLAALSSGVLGALKAREPASTTIEHEEVRMLHGVQFVQDCRRTGDYKKLEQALGRTSKQAVTYLRDLAEGKRSAYFDGFAAEIQQVCSHWQKQIDLPRPDRQPWEEPGGSRPWKRFVRSFSGSLEPLADIQDEGLAKCRLLAITAWALAAAKSTGSVPKNLEKFSKANSIDPYTGKPMLYAASGADFRVYSAGKDGRDDGGSLNLSGQDLDVTLETSSD